MENVSLASLCCRDDPIPIAVLVLSSMVVVVDLEETQSLTTTTNYVLRHLGHSKLVKKGKVREEDVKQA